MPLRWLLVRDPDRYFEPQALLSTDLDVAPQQMLEWFICGSQMEVTFEETRAHLGIETRCLRSDRAITRTIPALFALYSVVTLIAQPCMDTQPVRSAAWYANTQPTFSDALAWVRRWLWGHDYFSTSTANTDMIQIPRTLFERLIDALCYAA